MRLREDVELEDNGHGGMAEVDRNAWARIVELQWRAREHGG
jgi:hypothetical protein